LPKFSVELETWKHSSKIVERVEVSLFVLSPVIETETKSRPHWSKHKTTFYS
jgi:hypothetical protein